MMLPFTQFSFGSNRQPATGTGDESCHTEEDFDANGGVEQMNRVFRPVVQAIVPHGLDRAPHWRKSFSLLWQSNALQNSDVPPSNGAGATNPPPTVLFRAKPIEKNEFLLLDFSDWPIACRRARYRRDLLQHNPEGVDPCMTIDIVV